jgi:hypothetical protein
LYFDIENGAGNRQEIKNYLSHKRNRTKQFTIKKHAESPCPG